MGVCFGLTFGVHFLLQSKLEERMLGNLTMGRERKEMTKFEGLERQRNLELRLEKLRPNEHRLKERNPKYEFEDDSDDER